MPSLNRPACRMAQATNIASRKRAGRAPEWAQILAAVAVAVAGQDTGGGNLNSQISIRTRNRNDEIPENSFPGSAFHPLRQRYSLCQRRQRWHGHVGLLCSVSSPDASRHDETRIQKRVKKHTQKRDGTHANDAERNQNHHVIRKPLRNEDISSAGQQAPAYPDVRRTTSSTPPPCLSPLSQHGFSGMHRAR